VLNDVLRNVKGSTKAFEVESVGTLDFDQRTSLHVWGSQILR
jgi:hypothetical protein